MGGGEGGGKEMGDKEGKGRRESNQTVSGKPLLFHEGSDPTSISFPRKTCLWPRAAVILKEVFRK